MAREKNRASAASSGTKKILLEKKEAQEVSTVDGEVGELQDIEEGDDEDSGSESDSSEGSSDDEGFGEEGWVDKKGKHLRTCIFF